MYTPEEVKKLREEYLSEPTQETVNRLVQELGKSKKSIIGKLSREGIYQKITYKTKTGEDPITKKELVVQIAEASGGAIARLEGLEKAPKQALKYLLQCLNSSV